MSKSTGVLPITETLEPQNQAELATAIRESHEANRAVYPIGGGTSLDFGLPAKRTGVGLSLARLDRVIDFPARDLTVTVEAGIVMSTLTDVLAKEKLQLAVDVPRAEKAMLGGVVATNFNGYRRYGMGAIRDHIIGISAVDGRGSAFKGGGRVVKNVAGYDFCKLLTGSMGTLGVITQLTLKLKPLHEQRSLVGCYVPDLNLAERLLDGLAKSATSPAGIELVVGRIWMETELGAAFGNVAPEGPWLVVALEGTGVEVSWMNEKLQQEWRALGVTQCQVLQNPTALRSMLQEFPQHGSSPLSIRASIAPSGVTAFIAAAKEIDANCQIQAHAGNGSIIVNFSQFPAAGLARTLVGKLQPLAGKSHGYVTMLANPSGGEVTHQSVWGGVDAPYNLMTRIKKQFDPKDILNPGRFVYL